MNYDFDALFALAKECGFDEIGMLDPETLEFMPEVRDMCRSDKCNNYNRSWSCPPACGSLEDNAKRCKEYSTGFIVQVVARMEDEFDIETMMDAPKRFGACFLELSDKLKEMGLDILPMGAGGCTRCKKCTYPDEPCRHPDIMHVAMEAAGLVVASVCEVSGVTYNHGRGTLGYVSCVVL